MKSKKLTYVLLIVVAFVWYKVFFRVKDNLFGVNNQIESSSQPAPLNLLISKKDTVVLKLDYRDPFLLHSALKLKEQGIQLKVNKPKYDWPIIHYVGRIQKTNSSHPLAIIQIDGIQLFVRNNDEIFGDFRIKKIGRDSVVIKHKQEFKTFWRN